MDNLKLPQSRTEYMHALIDAAELGATKALEKAGLHKPFLKLSEAKRIYGRTTVERWIKEGLLPAVKDGNHSSVVRVSRLEIEALAKSANRSTYLTTIER